MQYNAVIIGGSSGFGREITQILLNNKKFNITVCGKKKFNNKSILFYKLNLLNLISIKKCVSKLKKIKKIDILILNSSSFFFKKKIIKSKFERSFLLNYLSQFYIINSLKEEILRSKFKKIIIISSHALFNSKIEYSDIQSLRFYNFWKSITKRIDNI